MKSRLAQFVRLSEMMSANNALSPTQPQRFAHRCRHESSRQAMSTKCPAPTSSDRAGRHPCQRSAAIPIWYVRRSIIWRASPAGRSPISIAARRDAVAKEFRATGGKRCRDPRPPFVLQCYYRDDRVLRSLGLGRCGLPCRLGYTLEQGDWSLLDPVKARPSSLRRAQ